MSRPTSQGLPVFQQCPGCSFDFMTGEGARSCSWYECPYLPEAYKVFCPDCNYNVLLGEGRPRCGDPPTCDWSQDGFRHAGNLRRASASGRLR